MLESITPFKKNEEISRQKAHTNTWKLNWNVLTIPNVFLNQKRVNVCEHMVKKAPHESFPVSYPLWWHFSNTLMWCRLFHVFTYFYSLLIEKDICDRRNISIKLLCVPFVRRSLHFLVRVSSFFSFLFLCYSHFSTFLSTWSLTRFLNIFLFYCIYLFIFGISLCKETESYW